MKTVTTYESANLVPATVLLGMQTSEAGDGELLLSASCSLQCDANVADRFVILRITDKDGRSLCVSSSNIAYTANLGGIVSFYPGTSDRSVAVSATITYQAVAIPNLWLPPGSGLSMELLNPAAGDLLEFFTFATVKGEGVFMP